VRGSCAVKKGEEEALRRWVVRSHLSRKARKVGTLKFSFSEPLEGEPITVECGDYGYYTDFVADQVWD